MSGARRGRPQQGRNPGRRPRARQQRGRSMVGEQFEVEVGPIAHGGHCVARLPEPESRVVFVRHTAPGERVRIAITEGSEGDRFWRADAVEVLAASPDRVSAPCPVAGPNGCGGCDFQHLTLDAQRRLKATVVAEQLQRLAGVEWPVEVEAVPGDVDGLRWRTRQRYVELPDGRRGMRKHRSHEVVVVDDCLLESPAALETAPGTARREVHTALGETWFDVATDGFWQVHPGAPQVLVETVLQLLAPQPGEYALDLYSGVGLFSWFLGQAVGEQGALRAIEGDAAATEHARANLADRPGRPWRGPVPELEAGSVADVLGRRPARADVVVLDPPREGAKRAVVEQVVAAGPRAVAYVACDPAALARDVAIFAESGYTLRELRAFDLFPMTHHVECVALLEST